MLVAVVRRGSGGARVPLLRDGAGGRSKPADPVLAGGDRRWAVPVLVLLRRMEVAVGMALAHQHQLTQHQDHGAATWIVPNGAEHPTTESATPKKGAAP